MGDALERVGARQAVVSLACVLGGVSRGRAGDADGWQPARAGLPVVTGDRLYAARGARAELHASAFDIQLTSATGLEALELTEGVRRFYVWGGSASFLVRRLEPGERFEVESPGATVKFERAGDYRIDVGGDSRTVGPRHREAQAVRGEKPVRSCPEPLPFARTRPRS